MRCLKRMVVTMVTMSLLLCKTVYAGTWSLENGKWYYIDENGKYVTGFLQDKGKEYYLDELTGEMLGKGVHLLSNDIIVICNEDGSVFYRNTFHKNGLDDTLLLKSYQDTYKYWNDIQQVFNDLQQSRINEGGTPFRGLEFELCVLATYRAEDMVHNGYFSHYDGQTVLCDREATSFFGINTRLNENLGRSYTLDGQKLPESELEYLLKQNGRFFNCPSHRQNIMEAEKEVGIGIATNEDSSLYITAQLFSV